MISLTERDREFLDHLRRYRGSTPSIVTPTICNGSEAVSKKLISRLRDYVASDPIGTKTVYYRLKPAGTKLLGAPEEISRPLGPQALPKVLGIVDFCCAGPKKRTRYTRQEFIEDFPELVKELLGKDYHTDFFIDADGEQARFGQIVVDLGGDYQKLLSKCRVRLREYLDVGHMRDIVADGLFTFAIVVAEEEKAASIRTALLHRPLQATVIVEVSSELQKYPLVSGGEYGA